MNLNLLSFQILLVLFQLFVKLNQGKKFAKPELKSSIEEFEEKLNKYHLEKKEQEVTARNAQAHKDRIDNLEGFIVAGKTRQENEDASITKGRCFRSYSTLFFYLYFSALPSRLASVSLLERLR